MNHHHHHHHLVYRAPGFAPMPWLPALTLLSQGSGAIRVPRRWRIVIVQAHHAQRRVSQKPLRFPDSGELSEKEKTKETGIYGIVNTLTEIIGQRGWYGPRFRMHVHDLLGSQSVTSGRPTEATQPKPTQNYFLNRRAF